MGANTFNRIDAITEVFALGIEAEALIIHLSETEANASRYRLDGLTQAAQDAMTEYTLTCHKLEAVGKRQFSIIEQLAAAGEQIFL